MTPLHPLNSPIFNPLRLKIFIKLDYLNHPKIQGNKLYKLSGHLEQAKRQNKQQLLTFGGAYSNHIAATAEAANVQGLESIGFIRGQEFENQPDKWSSTLRQASLKGMQFKFIDRQTYRQKNSAKFLDALTQQYPDALIIPEGGSNSLALKGFADLINQINLQCPNWTHLICPVGTGGTLAGLIHQAKKLTPNNITRNIIGISVVHDDKNQLQLIHTLLSDTPNHLEPINWQLITPNQAKKYGKESNQIKVLREEFEMHFHIPLDPVYNNHVLNFIQTSIAKQSFCKDDVVVWLHTGGLQGNHST